MTCAGWKANIIPLTAAVLVGCGGPAEPESRPNILLIVADDLGYADLGAFGSRIRTPNIDALAAEGVTFTQFHTAPVCAPTRAMLLSGNNNHVAGMGRQGGSSVFDVSVPGYEARLSDRIVPFPRLLRESGYHTYTAGKWHLGTAPEHGPTSAGFERSFNNAHGGGSHFSQMGFFEEGGLYRENDVDVEYPEGSYTTEIFTDHIIDFIDESRDDGRPFFAFAAYTSPHWPLQVPDSYLDLYAGEYDQGYDRLREENFEALKRAGIIPATSELPPRNAAITPWEDLTPEEQRVEARKMELYSSMVENLDFHVGRLVAYLKQADLYENTLIIFMSDNGAAAEDFFYVGPYSEYIQGNYDNSYENMGHPTSWVSYGPQWAEAGSAPFSRHKGYTKEGGIVAPMIAAGPGVSNEGGINRSYMTVMDLAPTFLEVAGASYPTDGSVWPMLGESLVPVLSGASDAAHGDDYVTILYHADLAFIRQGKWKLVSSDRPFTESSFELYDLDADPGESRNLAEIESERYEMLLELWRQKRRELGIIVPGDLQVAGR